MSLLQIEYRRTFLERVTIPKEIKCANCICKCRLSLYFCLFVIFMIDTFVLIKYVAMFSDKVIYSDDYPTLVLGSVIIKFLI